MNAGSRADHNRFCLTEGWELVGDAQGRAVRHHVTYELALPDGRVLRTRFSRPVNTMVYGPSLWRAILREQLEVTEGEFWACVKDKQVPERGRSHNEPTELTLPAGLVHQLIHVARVPERDVRELTLEQALALMAEHWSAPRSE